MFSVVINGVYYKISQCSESEFCVSDTSVDTTVDGRTNGYFPDTLKHFFTNFCGLSISSKDDKSWFLKKQGKDDLDDILNELTKEESQLSVKSYSSSFSTGKFPTKEKQNSEIEKKVGDDNLWDSLSGVIEFILASFGYVLKKIGGINWINFGSNIIPGYSPAEFLKPVKKYQKIFNFNYYKMIDGRGNDLFIHPRLFILSILSRDLVKNIESPRGKLQKKNIKVLETIIGGEKYMGGGFSNTRISVIFRSDNKRYIKTSLEEDMLIPDVRYESDSSISPRKRKRVNNLDQISGKINAIHQSVKDICKFQNELLSVNNLFHTFSFLLNQLNNEKSKKKNERILGYGMDKDDKALVYLRETFPSSKNQPGDLLLLKLFFEHSSGKVFENLVLFFFKETENVYADPERALTMKIVGNLSRSKMQLINVLFNPRNRSIHRHCFQPIFEHYKFKNCKIYPPKVLACSSSVNTLFEIKAVKYQDWYQFLPDFTITKFDCQTKLECYITFTGFAKHQEMLENYFAIRFYKLTFEYISTEFYEDNELINVVSEWKGRKNIISNPEECISFVCENPVSSKEELNEKNQLKIVVITKHASIQQDKKKIHQHGEVNGMLDEIIANTWMGRSSLCCFLSTIMSILEVVDENSDVIRKICDKTYHILDCVKNNGMIVANEFQKMDIKKTGDYHNLINFLCCGGVRKCHRCFVCLNNGLRAGSGDDKDKWDDVPEKRNLESMKKHAKEKNFDQFDKPCSELFDVEEDIDVGPLHTLINFSSTEILVFDTYSQFCDVYYQKFILCTNFESHSVYLYAKGDMEIDQIDEESIIEFFDVTTHLHKGKYKKSRAKTSFTLKLKRFYLPKIKELIRAYEQMELGSFLIKLNSYYKMFFGNLFEKYGTKYSFYNRFLRIIEMVKVKLENTLKKQKEKKFKKISLNGEKSKNFYRDIQLFCECLGVSDNICEEFMNNYVCLIILRGFFPEHKEDIVFIENFCVKSIDSLIEFNNSVHSGTIFFVSSEEPTQPINFEENEIEVKKGNNVSGIYPHLIKCHHVKKWICEVKGKDEWTPGRPFCPDDVVECAQKLFKHVKLLTNQQRRAFKHWLKQFIPVYYVQQEVKITQFPSFFMHDELADVRGPLCEYLREFYRKKKLLLSEQVNELDIIEGFKNEDEEMEESLENYII